MKFTFVGLLLLAISGAGAAWDGHDLESGASIEIEGGNLVRPGREIEFYDHDSGEYGYGDVESVRQFGSGVEVEVYDHNSGEIRIFEMED